MGIQAEYYDFEERCWKPYVSPQKEENTLRYPHEGTAIRIGTKRIKISGVEHPFIAVSDHWRPAIMHENRLVWIYHYRKIEGLRRAVFKVFYATAKVPYNRLPWTVDNRSFGNKEYLSLKDAIEDALAVAENREWVEKMESEVAARQLGQKGGSVRSERKTLSSKENGKRGGRPRKRRGEVTVNNINADDL